MQSVIDKLPDNWEADLEYQMLLRQRDRYSKCVYVCSPCGDSSKRAVYQNMRAARFYMRYILTEIRMAAKAPHAYMPVLFSDAVYAERSLALSVGLRVLEGSDFLFVCGGRISNGMRGEIEHAAKLGMPITVFHHDLLLDVKKIVTRAGADKRLVSYDPQYPLLSRSAAELFAAGEEERHA